MTGGGLIETVLRALKELGGYFVWRADDGEEYVIISRRDFEARQIAAQEEQLELLGQAGRSEAFGGLKTADDVLDKINRDLALFQLQREEEGNPEDVEEVIDGNGDPVPLPPIGGKRVRFEPLRGDLPPDLQD